MGQGNSSSPSSPMMHHLVHHACSLHQVIQTLVVPLIAGNELGPLWTVQRKNGELVQSIFWKNMVMNMNQRGMAQPAWAPLIHPHIFILPQWQSTSNLKTKKSLFIRAVFIFLRRKARLAPAPVFCFDAFSKCLPLTSTPCPLWSHQYIPPLL